MLKIFTTLSIVFLLSTTAVAQTTKCNDLFDFIIENGTKKATLTSHTLNSSWLYKVTAYTYKYKVYVIAEIKANEFSYKTSSYIFCGIPNQNWTEFQYGGYGNTLSHGERFQKYIMDYKCDCK